jgi:hypothetical protein
MWTYSQSTGAILQASLREGTGYSGFGIGLNNGALEAEPDIGPIPKGKWKIARWDDVHGEKGPIVAVLNPIGHDAHGRTGFLIHGDNAAMNHTASHGCIIANRNIRTNWRASKDMDLEVIA